MTKLSLNDKVKQPLSMIKLTKFYLINHIN